jgi:1-acyl-sn-glycerol-3-phosphate acyltransferase
MIRTWIVASFCVVFVILCGPPLIAYSFITRSFDLMYASTIRAFRIALWLAGVPVRVEGRENVPAGACIFAANHVSNLDPPAVSSIVGRQVTVMAKEEVIRIPIVGRALLMAKMISVSRRDKASAAASVEKALEYLHEGRSFLVFPEGTRSLDGRLRDFRKGIFVLAIRAGIPVVPVSVAGSQLCQRKGERTIHPGEIIVRFGPPVDSRNYSLAEKQALIDEVQSRVAAGLPPEQQPVQQSLQPSSSGSPLG